MSMFQHHKVKLGPEDIKLFSSSTQLNSTEHEISTASKKKLVYYLIKAFLASKPSDIVFNLLINVKMPTTVAILTFMSMINFMLS